jgi:hypothetical protein
MCLQLRVHAPLSRTICRVVAVCLLLLAPFAQADPASDTADLIAILRTIHDHCDIGGWKGPGSPVVISDKPFVSGINEITKRPFERYHIKLVPRAPAGTLWPRVTVCPGVSVADHAWLERALKGEGDQKDHAYPFALGFSAWNYEEISLPAFAPDGDRAVVYRGRMGPLGADGTYFEVTRTPHGWRISRQERIWVS